MVVCQWPRKPHDTQVCYLREPPLAFFQPVLVDNYWGYFYKIYIIMLRSRYTPPH